MTQARPHHQIHPHDHHASADNQAVLISLLDSVYDSIEGYRLAREKADSDAIKAVFADQLARREATRDALNNALAALGGEVKQRGAVTGGLHRLWLEISTLFGDSDASAISRVEEGEDYLAAKFETALEAVDLPPGTRAAIEQGLAEVRRGERLADRLQAAHAHRAGIAR